MTGPYFADSTTASSACDAFLLEAIQQRRSDLARPIIVGLCGPQGSGKSTMSARLADGLTRKGVRTTVLALDDFYLKRDERQELARRVHPLFITRGVPGTHDVDLARRSLDAALNAQRQGPLAVPVFDKAADDRAPETDWRLIDGPLDAVIFEGWCVGARAQPISDLLEPANRLERDEDPEGLWRAYANQQLSETYQELFRRLDLSVLLRAPSFEIVQQWRGQQELGLPRSAGSPPPMDASALHRFISHYERLTRWMLQDEPADLVVDLDVNRIPMRCRAGGGR